MPGYSVDFIAVKAADYFTLYKLSSPLSAGSWNTDSLATLLPNQQAPDLSHIVFFGSVVPEPQAWAMLIAGFGLVGAMRRRRRALGVTLA